MWWIFVMMIVGGVLGVMLVLRLDDALAELEVRRKRKLLDKAEIFALRLARIWWFTAFGASIGLAFVGIAGLVVLFFEAIK